MNINGFNSLISQIQAPEGLTQTARSTSPSTSFGDVVRRSVESLDQTQKGAETEIARAVAGESPDLHRTIVSLQSAELNFQFALQVRNKLIGAYDDIMKMQV